jgi:hypothetical protein
MPYICDIFKVTLESGVFQEKWKDGIIIPIYKKGDTNDVNRGITLLSCLSKLFTSVLNNRIVSFCEINQEITDAQYGFKKDSSTIDAIFALYTLIEHYLNHNERLYVGFIDLKNCFETHYCLSFLNLESTVKFLE